jgi:hypothetical protein
MDKLKKYKKQIVTFITISLLLTYGIYPCLTAANTFYNIVGAIALGILILWGILEVKDVYDRENEEERIFNEQIKVKLESELGPVIDKMAKEVLVKPKTKRKPKSVVKIDFTDAKGMNEIDGVIKPIAEGRVKISVETPKTKRKPKTK